MIHVRHAAAAIASDLGETVLIIHDESGRSGVGRTRDVVSPTSLAGQFEQPYGPMGPPTLFTIPVLRHMKTLWPDRRATGDGLSGAARMGGEEPARHIQDTDHCRGCAELADDRLPVPAVAVLPGDRWRRRPDPGFGRARPRLPAKLAPGVNRGPVYLLGTGESAETPMVSQIEDFTSSRAFRVAGFSRVGHGVRRPRSISSSSGAGGAGTAGFLMTNRVPSNLSITPSSASKRSSKVWNWSTFAMHAVAR
jgi:hypothetical protein